MSGSRHGPEQFVEISGCEPADRAAIHAETFGASISVPAEVTAVAGRARRVACALLGLVLSLPAVGGCSVRSPSLHVTPDTPVVDVGPLHVRGLVMVTSADERAVAVVFTIINDDATADRLDRVEIWGDRRPESLDLPGRATARTATPTPDLAVEPNLALPAGVVRVGGPDNPHIDLADPQRRIRSGQFVTLVLSFAGAGTVDTLVLVQAPVHHFAPYAPRPAAPGTGGGIGG